METTTRFDLNQAIQRWREGFAQSPAFQRDNVDEMETHLRDSIASLQSRGLSEAEAFQIASQRLGGAEQLNAEFAKTNASTVWRHRALWMLVGLLFYGLASNVAKAIQAAFVCSASAVTTNGLALGWLSGGLNIVLFVGTVFLFWRIANGRVGGLERWKMTFLSRPFLCITAFCLLQLLLFVACSLLNTLAIKQSSPLALGQRAMVETGFRGLLMLAHSGLLVAGVAWLGLKRAKRVPATRVAACFLIGVIALSASSSPVHAQDQPRDARLAATEKPATLADAMKLWREGKQSDAVAKFLAVDFSKRPLFPTGSVLNMTEAEFIALPSAARDKMSKAMLDDIQTIKLIAGRVKELAKTPAKSAPCLSQLKAAGEAFDRPGGLALLKLVGQAFKKMAAAQP